MTSLKSLKLNIASHQSMKGLIEVYEETSATTMRRIRSAIMASREYYRGLAELSAEVGADLSLLRTVQDQKSAIVFISGDTSMSGDIVDKVFGRFIAAIKADKNADVFIEGQVGQDLIKMVAPEQKYVVIESQKIGDALYRYRNIEVIFGQFESIARQEPMTRSLSATSVELTGRDWAGDIATKLKYLYEPTIDQVSTVFGKQIFTGVLEQTMKEDELAKNGSRLMHLDQALTSIDKLLERDGTKYHSLKKRITSKKQHTQVAGYRSNLATKAQRTKI